MGLQGELLERVVVPVPAEGERVAVLHGHHPVVIEPRASAIVLTRLVHLEEEIERHPGLDQEAAHLEHHLLVPHPGDLLLGEEDGRSRELLDDVDKTVVIGMSVRDQDPLDRLREVAGRVQSEEQRVLCLRSVDPAVNQGDRLRLDQVDVDRTYRVGGGQFETPNRQGLHGPEANRSADDPAFAPLLPYFSHQAVVYTACREKNGRTASGR